MSICFIGDVNFDHLAKVVSARILYCKCAFPPSLLDFDHSHFVILWDYGFKTKKSFILPLHFPITLQSHTHVPLYA